MGDYRSNSSQASIFLVVLGLLVFEEFIPLPTLTKPGPFCLSQEKDPDLLSYLAGPGTVAFFTYYVAAVLSVFAFMIKRVIN